MKLQKKGTANWNSIAYGNGKYVVVGGSEEREQISEGIYATYSYVSSSTDGISWSTPTKIGAMMIGVNRVVYGNGKFVAIDNYNSYTSSDGINWSNGYNIDHNRSSFGLTYGNGKFVTVGASGAFQGGYGAYSTDGMNWSDSGTEFPIIYGLGKCVFGNGKFIALGYSSQTNYYDGLSSYFAQSADGISWKRMRDGNNDVTYGTNGKFVYTEGGNYGGIMVTDFEDYNESAKLDENDERVVWGKISYCNGKYVAISKNNECCICSTDGINWAKAILLKDENGNPPSNINELCVMQ